MPNKKLRQEDIAQTLGISVATVSRALRNESCVNASTRARVFEAAAKLGYRLPPGSIAPPEPLTALQVVLGYREGPSIARETILAGITEAAGHLDVQTSVSVVEDERLDDQQADGLILVHALPFSLIEPLARGTPCVSIGHRYAGVDVDYIGTDQTRAASELVTAIHRQGHARIGFVGTGEQFEWERRRFGGYREGLFGCDLPYDSRDVLTNDDSSARLADQVEERIDEGVTGWLCATSPIAYEIMRELQARGRLDWSRIAIAGYDGMESPPGLDTLTKVGVPYRELGVAAVRLLLSRIDDPTAMVRDVLIRHSIEFGTSLPKPDGWS